MAADRRSLKTPEWLVIVEWDWVVIGRYGERLHAVERITNAATVDDDWYGQGFTVCGLGGDLSIPGVFTRMGAKRCDRCCDRRHMPRGIGSPKNDDGCRAFVEGRVTAMKTLKATA